MTTVAHARPRALRLAHRGDWRYAPENSLAAMAAALAIPACDGLEFDVRGSADGVPVLLHDSTLARVQGLDARVRDLTAAELAVHGIPTLAEVLDAASVTARAGQLPFLDIELKGDPVASVIDVLEAARGPSLERAVISSFEPSALAWLGERRPAWRRWLNARTMDAHVLAEATRLGCVGVSVLWPSIDVVGMTRAIGAGLQVAAWTVTELADYRRLDALGVVAVCAEGAALDG